MLTIANSAFDALRRHGESAYPHESCGVLLGRRSGALKQVHEAVACGNARRDSPATRYSIDPVELIRIQQQARERDCEIVGFYHSHPDHPARWSPTDLAQAFWSGFSYVITSVEQGRATRTCAFELAGTDDEDKHFLDEEIRVDSAESASPRN